MDPQKAVGLKLKSDVLGLLGAATMGVVVLSPAMTLYGGFGPTFLAAGKAAPLSLVWALLATLPTAISYSLLSRDYPSSGSVASWVGMTSPKPVAIWAGWMVFLYYFCNFVIEPVTLGVFGGDLFKLIGVEPNLWTYSFGALLCCVWAGWIVYRGISISTKGALAFLLFESVVVIALCGTIVWKALHGGGQPLGLEGFHVETSPTGTSGIFQAMVFATLAYCGFDVVSTLAEETKMAKRLIPQATLLSLFLYSFLIIGGIWCLTYGGDPGHLKQVSESGQMPISEVASRYWGGGAIWVTLTAISAALGLTVAVGVGASRILFSMGREGSAPSIFARLHERTGVPSNALHLIFGVGIAAALLSGLVLGPYESYVWWGTTVSFFALLTYLLAHLANLALNRKRAFNGGWSFLGYCVVPVVGIAVDCFLLVRIFFIELWNQGWATGRSVMLFDVGCAIVAGLAAIWVSRKNTGSVQGPRGTI